MNCTDEFRASRESGVGRRNSILAGDNMFKSSNGIVDKVAQLLCLQISSQQPMPKTTDTTPLPEPSAGQVIRTAARSHQTETGGLFHHLVISHRVSHHFQ